MRYFFTGLFFMASLVLFLTNIGLAQFSCDVKKGFLLGEVENPYLFKDREKAKRKFNPFVEGTVYTGLFAGRLASVTGIEAGLILKKKWLLSGGYHRNIGKFTPVEVPVTENRSLFQLQYLSGQLTYLIHPEKMVHFSIPLRGGLGLLSETFIRNGSGVVENSDDIFLMVYPGFNVEIRLTKNITSAVGGHFRIADKVDFLENRDISGMGLSFSLRVDL